MVIVLNMWFWATPIVWQIGMLPVSFRPYMELNPLNYVIEGYREAFLGVGPIRVDFGTTAYFWLVAVGLLLLGATVFRRLKPNFAEVL
jgi:lipopolysaccharide transport system permease protein/teichoic acid transport system permease protein